MENTNVLQAVGFGTTGEQTLDIFHLAPGFFSMVTNISEWEISYRQTKVG